MALPGRPAQPGVEQVGRVGQQVELRAGSVQASRPARPSRERRPRSSRRNGHRRRRSARACRGAGPAAAVSRRPDRRHGPAPGATRGWSPRPGNAPFRGVGNQLAVEVARVPVDQHAAEIEHAPSGKGLVLRAKTGPFFGRIFRANLPNKISHLQHSCRCDFCWYSRPRLLGCEMPSPNPSARPRNEPKTRFPLSDDTTLPPAPPPPGAPQPPQPPHDIAPITIEEEMKRSYLDYAMSVIVARALPDVRDGLKPVQRRILYAMKEGGYDSARAVPQVRAHRRRRDGQVSPARRQRDLRRHGAHGAGFLDAPAADRGPGQLRLDGRRSAGGHALHRGAARHASPRRCSRTSTRTPSISSRTTTSASRSRRSCRRAFPNLLVNGAGGIAVGMATNIPPHNLGEVIDACVALIDDPDLDDRSS